MGESECSVGSSKPSEEFVDQTESNITHGANLITGSVISVEPSAETASSAGQQSVLDKSVISFSFRSQSSTDSNDTIFEPRKTDVRRSEACMNDQPIGGDHKPSNTIHCLPANKHDQPCSVRSSYAVSDVTRKSMLMPPREIPQLQVMDRSGVYEPGRISSPAFTPPSTPQKWSAASNESLFSLSEGRISSITGVLAMGVTSHKPTKSALSSEQPSRSSQPSGVAERATATTDKGEEQAGPSLTDIGTHDSINQQIHDSMDSKARIPEISRHPSKNIGKIQPLPPSVRKKSEKPSSRCGKWNCCLCSCKSVGSCCARPRCNCCKMPSISCCNCSLKWCCSWNCCSKKTCCPSFNCCFKRSCCPKGSCCPSCSNCTKAICCWNWSCWKLFSCSNWNCCSKELFCCSKGSSCTSWSCCSKKTCCLSRNCCSVGTWSKGWNCCSKGTCCKGWNCCSKGTCCRSWNCCSKGTFCISWNCCSKGTCCRSWNCCSKGSCCKS